MTDLGDPPADAVDDEVSAAAATQAELAVAPELVATSLRDYLGSVVARVRGGESGVLPVVGGLILISALFQALNSNFLTSGNLVNLLVQGAAYMLLAMGAVFPLLLGEIDLSIGYVSGIGGVVMAELVKQGVDATGRTTRIAQDLQNVADSLTVLTSKFKVARDR